MLALLQSHMSLVLGALLVVLLFAGRSVSSDKELRRDLRDALAMLLAFVGLRLAAWSLERTLPASWAQLLDVAWMLMFAFGCVRAGMALMLRVMRLRSQAAVPKILRDVVGFVLHTLVAVPILQTQLNLNLTGLVATSAVLSVVIGLALQETLGNLFAGLSLQLERPFEVGDFIKIGEHTGRVVQIAWRATRIATFRREVITVPNSKVAKEVVKNFSNTSEPVGIDLYLNLSFEAPPNAVRAAVLGTLREVPNILEEPPSLCRAWAYDESSIRYQVRYFVPSLAYADGAMSEFYARLWYRLKRDGIEFAYPQRMVHTRHEPPRPAATEESVTELLRTVDLFALLDVRELERLRGELVVRRFGTGERIIQEGEEGRTFYLVASGEVSVRAGKGLVEVTRLHRGHYFGEMSLLTGEPRSATVVALEDVVLLEVDRPTFARLFASDPGLARQLSALLAQRRTQLRAVAESHGGVPDTVPEAGRIFGKLRQIFGLSHD
ncbi:mechanosensitive ion channel family protein [Myxococcaceae bacterium GXIMD 01537]